MNWRVLRHLWPFLLESKQRVLLALLCLVLAKGAVITLTKELARGLAPDVRVNAISPSYVHPESTNFPLKWDTVFEDTLSLPLQRPGTGEEYAEACLFLCAGAGYITGQTIHVDGGWSA